MLNPSDKYQAGREQILAWVLALLVALAPKAVTSLSLIVAVQPIEVLLAYVLPVDYSACFLFYFLFYFLIFLFFVTASFKGVLILIY